MEENMQLPKVGISPYMACMVPVPDAADMKPDVPALVVNLITLLAIAVFVHDEVRRAVNLCHTAAVVAGILPVFYTTGKTQGLIKSTLHWLLCIVVLCAPVLQMITALLVLLSASVLSITQEMQASSIQVVLNSVALGFVLEIDNRVGHMIAAQQQQWVLNGTASVNSFMLSTCLPVSRLRSFMVMYILQLWDCFLPWSLCCWRHMLLYMLP
jgi:hypothetical protein